MPALNGQPIAAPAPATLLHTPGPPNGYAPAPGTTMPTTGPTMATTGMNGHVPTAAPIAVGSTREASQPILPPRETGRWRANQKPASSIWRSWPMLVIGMAVLAIVAAVVIMVLPQDSKKSGKKIGAPPPAPERMDVDPTNPKSSQLTPPQGADPWAAPSYPSRPSPDPRPQQPQPADPNDPNDLFGGLGGGNMNTPFFFGMYDHACKKFKSCPGADASALDVLCSQFSSYNVQPSTCPAAQRCFEAIDRLPCTQDDDASSIMNVTTIVECTTAMRDC